MATSTAFTSRPISRNSRITAPWVMLLFYSVQVQVQFMLKNLHVNLRNAAPPGHCPLSNEIHRCVLSSNIQNKIIAILTRWKDVVTPIKLFDVSQPLELWSVNYLNTKLGQFDTAVNWVVENLINNNNTNNNNNNTATILLLLLSPSS